jgi:hypothetical protein
MPGIVRDLQCSPGHVHTSSGMQHSPYTTITFGEQLGIICRTFGEHWRTFGELLENTEQHLESTVEHWGTFWEHLETIRLLMQRSGAPLDYHASVAQQHPLNTRSRRFGPQSGHGYPAGV